MFANATFFFAVACIASAPADFYVSRSRGSPLPDYHSGAPRQFQLASTSAIQHRSGEATALAHSEMANACRLAICGEPRRGRGLPEWSRSDVANGLLASQCCAGYPPAADQVGIAFEKADRQSVFIYISGAFRSSAIADASTASAF